MALPRSAVEYYAQQRSIRTVTLAAARRLWGNAPPTDFDQWFARNGDTLVALVSAGQRRAVAGSEEYVATALDELGTDIAPQGVPNSAPLIGVASDGRRLDGVLYSPIVTAKTKAAQGVPTAIAWANGRDALLMHVGTQISDSARASTGLSITARRGVGYSRMLVPPTCSRCAILAGRWYRYSKGFQRHPGCDCRQIPALEDVADDVTTDPRTYFDSLDATAQDDAFTKAGAQAIRDGADMNRVVNVRGVTAAGEKRYRGAQLMPEQIYRVSSTREQAIGLLRVNGYMQ